VFVPASGDITNNIGASIGQVPPGGPGYAASSGAGIFGQVGLDMRQSAVPSGSTLLSEVFIASDEFVNLFGGPRSVQSTFIIDGGMFRDLFSASNTITLTLEIGAQNLGPVGAASDRDFFESDARFAADFGGYGGFFDGFEGGGTPRGCPPTRVAT
jgi:hypothetical protein